MGEGQVVMCILKVGIELIGWDSASRMDALYPVFLFKDREAPPSFFGPFEVHDPGLDGTQNSLFDPGLGLAAKGTHEY